MALSGESLAVRSAHEIGEDGAYRIDVSGDNAKPARHNGALIFYHVAKTAGTTVSTILSNVYKGKYLAAQSEKNLIKYCDNLENYSIIGGHFSPDFIFQKFNFSQILTILRDPIDRNLSQYSNWKDDARIEWQSDVWDIDENAISAFNLVKSISPFEFMNQTENALILSNTRNVFVRSYAGRTNLDPLDDDPRLVEEAFENLRRAFWIGIFEELPSSLLMLSRQLSAPSIIGSARDRHNMSTTQIGLSGSDLEEARRLNALDYALYDLAKQEFDRRYRTAAADAMRRIADHSYVRSCLWRLRNGGCSGFRDIAFMRGWSYEEQDGLARPFRWSTWGEEAVILVNEIVGVRSSKVIICLNVLAIHDDLDIDDLSISWGGEIGKCVAKRVKAGSIELRFPLDVEMAGGGGLIELRHSAPQPARSAEDGRMLGVALHSVSWEVLTRFNAE